jgi:hypothetical protein
MQINAFFSFLIKKLVILTEINYLTIMKSFIVIISVILVGTTSVFGQNYIGMDHNKIIKRFGEPDIIGNNYIVYTDLFEGGTNTYYFDQNEKCTYFIIEREINYLKEYTRILNKEFFKISENKFHKEQNNVCLSAELNQSDKNFKILIKSEERNLTSIKDYPYSKEYTLN